MIVQLYKSNAFGVAIKLLVLLFVSHVHIVRVRVGNQNLERRIFLTMSCVDLPSIQSSFICARNKTLCVAASFSRLASILRSSSHGNATPLPLSADNPTGCSLM